MKVNESSSIATSKVLLVPYEAHHVLKYHGWMKDPAIQEATASEPMTLEEEYENQLSWRTSHDKLTFIVCQPLAWSPVLPLPAVVVAQEGDKNDKMKGDINFFLYPDEDDDEGDDAQATTSSGTARLIGEVDVMIADEDHRRQGFGSGSVQALLVYVRRHLDSIMKEYMTGEGIKGDGELVGLMAKIKESNTGSRALFQKLGFTQKGEVNYFGEVTLVMSWADAERLIEGWQNEMAGGLHELQYQIA